MAEVRPVVTNVVDALTVTPAAATLKNFRSPIAIIEKFYCLKIGYSTKVETLARSGRTSIIGSGSFGRHFTNSPRSHAWTLDWTLDCPSPFPFPVCLFPILTAVTVFFFLDFELFAIIKNLIGDR